MVDDALDLASHVALIDVEDIVIDQCHFFHDICRWVLSPELVIEVEFVLTDLAVLQVLRDLQVAEEIRAVAIDHWYPLLALLGLIVESEYEGADG